MALAVYPLNFACVLSFVEKIVIGFGETKYPLPTLTIASCRQRIGNTCRKIVSICLFIQLSIVILYWFVFGTYNYRLSSTELFRSPLPVSGTNYRATSRLQHPCEFSVVGCRLLFLVFPFPTFYSACGIIIIFRPL